MDSANQTQQFLKKCLKEINTSEQRFNHHSYTKQVEIYTKSNEDFKLIPESIRTWILNASLTETCMTGTINGRNYQISFIHLPTTSQQLIKKYFKKMWQWLNIIGNYASASCSNNLIVYIYLTPFKKQLPLIHKTPIDVENVNTAFTRSCIPENSIIIFREEEWFKVFIHETFHCLGLDFSEMESYYAKTNTQVLKIFPALSKQNVPDLRFFETYCEVWAEVWNILFIYSSKNRQTLQTLFDKERQFSVQQNVKLLRHFDIEYKNLFDIKPVHYREKTQAFSYFILKSVFMFYLDDFIGWCCKNNRNQNPMQFKKTAENIQKYIAFLGERCHAGLFMDIVERTDVLTDDSLKMTCLTF
jgi:hypothetical protein